MLRNYLLIAWRNLLRHKVFSLINLLGLAIGMAACLLIFTYVQHEFTYDAHHEKAERIYRVTTRIRTPGVDMALALSDVLLAPALQADFPEVQQAVRFQPIAPTVRYQDQLFKEMNVYFADPGVFDVFTYPLLKGASQQVLAQPNSAVLTESLSKKYFGKTDPMGKTLYFDKEAYTVTGILADLPTNSDLKFEALLSGRFSNAATWFMEDPSVYTFVLLHPETDVPRFRKKLPLIFEKYYKPAIFGMSEEAVPKSMKDKILFDLSLEALTGIHYNKELLADTPKGNQEYNYIFSITAFFILLIALLNYINLTTSKSAERAKEVGIRKISGAYRPQLIGQFLFESLLLTVLSVGLAFTLFQIILPSFNQLFQVQLHPVWHRNWLLMLGLLVLVTLAAGAYPALVLSAFQPIRVLKGKFLPSAKGIPLRQSLIVVQFVLATGMIIGTVMTFRQMHHLRTLDLGFNKAQALIINLPEDSLVRQSLPALQNELLARAEIRGLTVGSSLHPESVLPMGSTFVEKEGKKTEFMANYLFIDEAFLDLFQIQIRQGRNLSKDLPTDKAQAFLVNEAFAKMTGQPTVLGEEIEGFGHQGKIVGVVKDFHYQSLHNKVAPLVLIYNSFPPASLTLKLEPKQLGVVKAVWEKWVPQHPLEYTFLDAAFDAQYRTEERMINLFNAFTALAVLLSCLGLYGLVSFSVAQRTKEIGIRKVLGADIPHILFLLSKDFLKLVLLASLIAVPLSYWLVNQWLENYSSRIEIGFWFILTPCLLILVIAMLTVSVKTWKTARQNPVKALRYE